MDATTPKPRPPLTEEDVAMMVAAAKVGDIEEVKRIVESKGLTWLSCEVEMSQIQQLPREATVLCNE